MPKKITLMVRAASLKLLLPAFFLLNSLHPFDSPLVAMQSLSLSANGLDPAKIKLRIDKDGDGLSDHEEKALGTNPRSPDSDKDGLIDCDEINRHFTDPTQADSDRDGLSDFDEIEKYLTDPKQRDSDQDGLEDAFELQETLTDPLRPDSDHDGLPDGEEVLQYRTDPRRRDSDGDGLSDGEEVRSLLSNALATDSDGDGVSDEQDQCPTELESVNNYQDHDGCPDEQPAFWVEIGQSFLLSRVTFAEGQTQPMPHSLEQLDSVCRTLQAFPELAFEIRGYADNSGEAGQNLQISLARAQAVYDYLVACGISRERIRCAGFGEANAIAPNTSAEGRAKNRRIELYRLH
ncbi:MAG: OmpA family protein [candidate division KSB1 bacterium]|nr:OmpA family protein [candidate division KSB1 bacterium]MDZ7275683.1 OmpA family protein [candidate division KSB1 bacterium]MDZ7284626.1 OmpA family protein [candidate division KSB1 bacterium]MDZ7297955.1 OmpA family protein [candidate division KSB1 bacterium]MDZ7308316.1 OmpA family protein [candidate division KSB1 bacterium]